MTNQCLDKTNAFVWNTETIHGINLIINQMTLSSCVVGSWYHFSQTMHNNYHHIDSSIGNKYRKTQYISNCCV